MLLLNISGLNSRYLKKYNPKIQAASAKKANIKAIGLVLSSPLFDNPDFDLFLSVYILPKGSL